MLVCQRVICNAGLGNDSAVSCESKPVTTVIHVRIRCHPFGETCRMCWSLLVAKHVYIYIIIYIYMCVNILAHIHIILHKLWVSRYPAYIYWVASTYQNLDPQNPSKSNEFSCLFHKGHGATRPWGTRQSSAALPSEASPEVPGVRGLKWLAGEDWVFSWIL